jgi:hypothetical protein
MISRLINLARRTWEGLRPASRPTPACAPPSPEEGIGTGCVSSSLWVCLPDRQIPSPS